MTAVPQDGDAIQLRSGETGWVRQVISYWGNHRCWDILLSDPDHHDEAPQVGHDSSVRVGQIREKKRDGKHAWREIQP